MFQIMWERNCLPLLDTVEALQGRDGDKDDNSLLAVANFDLFKTQNQHASSRTSLGPLPVLFHRSQLYSGWHARPATRMRMHINQFFRIEHHVCCASGAKWWPLQ